MKNISPKAIYIMLAVLFILLITLSNQMLRHMRIDMTENNAYTLSESTFQILDKIDQPLNLYLFFSESASKDYQVLRKYYTRVKEMLEEFELHAGGKIVLQFVDPEPFSEEEDRAASLGLSKVPVQVKSGESFYFGLAGTNVIGQVEKIPYFDVQRGTFLEYDIDKFLYSLINPEKKTIGLMTSLPMHSVGLKLPGLANSGKGWAITDQLEQRFDVELVFDDVTKIDDKISVLMVVHPKKEWSDSALYAIDQYVLGGGKAVFFVDPYADVEEIPVPDDIPAPEGVRFKGSTLNRLFEKWGFKVDTDKVVADLPNALRTAAPGQAAQRNIVMMGLSGNNIDQKDVVTAKLDRVNFGIASYVQVLDEEKVKMTPLIWTSKQSDLLPVDYMHFLSQPSYLLEHFKKSDKQYPIVARLEAQVESAFDKAPLVEAEEGEEGEEAPEQPQLPPHISKAEKPANLVVIADVDVLADKLWARSTKFLNQEFLQPIASNHNLVINLLDNMLGDEALIGIRGRAVFNRPFTKVSEIQEQADLKYRSTAESLQRKLRETEQRLQTLQNQRADDKSAILTAEQQAEVAKIRQESNQTRRKLREVKHKLAKDIDALYDNIKVINIGLMPALITVFAVLFAFFRTRRNRRA